MKTKFNRIPFGLGFHHIEIEESAAHHWNQCIDENHDPAEFLTPSSKYRIQNVTEPNSQTKISGISAGVFEIDESGKMLRLTGMAIGKINKFLSEK